MFVDASAIVAILTREDDADLLAGALDDAASPITSPVAIFEAALGICRKTHASVQEARGDVASFLEMANIESIAITAADADIAPKLSRDTARGVATLRGSIWAIASPTR